jgi:thiol:disulfide interchange protein
MKNILILLIALVILPILVNSQILEPVKWKAGVEQTTPGEATLLMTATIDKHWHLYSQDIPAGGPIPTSFTFTKSRNYELLGQVLEPKPIVENDPNFDMILKFFGNKAVFKQKIKVLSKNDFVIRGSVNFMCCDDKQCLAPNDVDFEFNIRGNPDAVEIAATDVTGSDTAAGSPDSALVSTISQADSGAFRSEQDKLLQTDAEKAADKSLLWFFLISFLAGLAAIVTPCVFPMIPMTVTFFMHDTTSKRKARLEALVYGLSIIVIYTVIGTVVAVTLGANFANFLSTHWIPNVFFFLIFVFFAASFLGMFEITLPSWIVNKADKQADKGGYSGAFFMAFTLVLVSFSCTGPIVGAILVQSAGGAILLPIIGMLGFSLAFALPFGLFAFFPSWLSGLPKSGGWLNSVKVVLGFLELALGLKFLSIADQTYHWHILDREVYLAIWIVIFFLMGMYLLGKLKFNHDSDQPYLSVPRTLLAIVVFSFVVYMIPGMWGAPLKALSGYLPPTTYQDFDINTIVKNEVAAVNAGGGGTTGISSLCDKPKYADFLKIPHGLEGYFDFDQALACARKVNKPIFIDFTGHGCVNCREMEANVWSDPKVLQRLREHYIVTALYVDDKTELPENEWVVSTYDNKVKKTIGKIFADLQITRYNVNSQPYYLLLDTSGHLLAKPRAYDLNIDAFVEFLDTGIENFRKQQQ